MIFISVGLVSSTISYDAQDKWDRYALSSGVSRRTAVLSKYVFTVVTILCSLALGLILALALGYRQAAGRRLFLCGRVKRRHRPALFFPFRRGKGARHLHDRHCFHRCVDGRRHFFIRAVEFCRAGALDARAARRALGCDPRDFLFRVPSHLPQQRIQLSELS